MASNLFEVMGSDTEPETRTCDGLFYRGVENSFLSKHGEYVYQNRMRLLKRKSCKGCWTCVSMLEEMEGFITDGYPPEIDEIENGALYQLRIINQTRTHTLDGCEDEYDYGFVKVKE